MVTVVLLCLGLAACTPTAPTARANTEELVVAVPAGSTAKALQVAAEAYASAGGERVRVEAIAGDAYYDRASAALLSGQNRYDLLYLPAETMARWVQYNALRPISIEIDRQPLAPWLPALTFNQAGTERLFALPARSDPLLLWYRADLLAAANTHDPASSLEAFRANAAALNAPPERYGVAMAGSDLDAGLDYAALLAGSPGDLLDAVTSAELQPHARQVLALYAGLRLKDGVTAPGAERFTRSEVIQDLREGRAAMGFAPLSAAETLLDCAASPKACEGDQPLLKAARLPGEDCAVLDNFSAWGIPLHAANPQAAERFAAWLVSEEGARAWASGGALPAHTGLLQDLPAGELPEEIVPVLARAECYEQVFPNLTTGDALLTALHNAAHAAAAGDMPPDAAFERAVQEIQQGLRQGGAVR